MKKKVWVVFFMLTICMVTYSQSITYTVSDKTSLITRMVAANPGDTIIVANGSYSWGQINFNNTKGTPNSNWIVLKAQTPNGVVFTGNTYLQFSGNRILVSGFKFANGNSGANDVIQFRSSSSVLANYCRVTNITIDNYNSDSTGAYLGLGTDVNNKWISLYGTNNRVDHCTLINKTNNGATVTVWFVSVVYPAQSVSTYHTIDSNYFKGRSYPGNGGESIRVGTSTVSRTNGYNIIEYNLFEGLTQAEPEVISNKTNYNIYRYNTIKNSSGGITLRHGRYCSVYGNFIINNNPTTTDDYGIRIIDKGHKVFNNYIEGVNGNKNSLTSLRAPISLYNGFYASSDTTDPAHSSGYWPADSCVVAFNTIVNAVGGAGIVVGHTDGGANIYQPLGIKLANNVIKMTTGQAAYADPANTILAYSAEGNVFEAPNGRGLTSAVGFTSASLPFSTRINGMLTPTILVQDAAINTSSYAATIFSADALGQSRSAIFDIGAIELNGTGTIKSFPLDSSKVGAGTPLQQSQTISFAPLAAKFVGDADFNAGAVSSAGLTISYTSSNTAVATIVNGNIQIIGAGTCVIKASQSGNNTFVAATDVSQTLVVNKKSQTITFSPLVAKFVGDADFNAGAVSSAGLTITYSSSNTAIANIVNGNIQIVGAGACIITASQTGNNTFNPATDVSQTLTINKKSQTITFASIPIKFLNSTDFNPGATASSLLAITYTSSNLAVATIVNGNIRIVGIGITTITAAQNGNDIFNAATNQTQVLTVNAAVVYNYTPVSATILSGSLNSGNIGNLVTNDGSYYVINSTTTNKRTVDWYATFSIVQSSTAVAKLTINYVGKNSISRSQLMYLYNWSTGTWVQINSNTVSTTDVLTTIVQTSPANFISSTGQVRVRVYSTGGTSNYRCSGDWLQLGVENLVGKTNPSTPIQSIYTNSLTAYPNPVAKNGTIHFSLDKENTVHISLYNLQGQLIKTIIQQQLHKAGNYTKAYSVEGLNAGNYLLLFKTENFEKVLQLLIIK